MAISYGDYAHNLRAGINIVEKSKTDTSITYTAIYYAHVRAGINNSMDAVMTGAHSATKSFRMDVDWGGSKLQEVFRVDKTYSRTYSGGPTVTFSIRIDRYFAGVTPRHSRSLTIPARPSYSPNAPGGLSVSNVGSNGAKLSWNAPTTRGAAVTGYQVLLATNSDFTSGRKTYTTTSRSITISDRNPGVRYYAQVRANSSKGYGTYSSSVNFLTQGPPARGGTPRLDELGHNSAKLSWDAPNSGGSAITGYRTQYSKSSNFSSPTTETQGTGRTKSIANLDQGTTYYFRYAAGNSIGYGDYSAARTFTTHDVPGAPARPTATPGATSVDLVWSAPSNNGQAITGYRAEVSPTSDFATIKASKDFGNVTSGTVSGLDQGQSYYARMIAINSVGEGLPSAGRSFKTYYSDLSVYPTPKPIVAVDRSSETSHELLALIDIVEGHPFASGTRTVEYKLIPPTGPDITGTVDFVSRAIVPGQGGSRLSFSSDTEMGLLIEMPEQGTHTLEVRTAGSDNLKPSDWVSVTVTSEHVPTAAITSPVGGVFIEWAPTIEIQVRASDPSPGEEMSAYRLEVSDNATGVVVFDSGKVFKTFPTSSPTSIEAEVPLATQDKPMRARLRVWDSTDTPSKWTGYSAFTPVTPNTIDILHPDSSGEVSSGSPMFRWALNTSLGRRAETTVLGVTEDGRSIWKRTIPGAVSNFQPPQVILANGGEYKLTVDIVDTRGLTAYASREFEASYVAPPPLAYEIEQRLEVDGYNLIDWSGSDVDSKVKGWKIYRREVDGEWDLLVTISDTTIRQYRDYLVRPGRVYLYNVVQSADRYGEIIDSPLGARLDSDSSSTADDREVAADVSQYWLISEEFPDLSTMIPNVTSAPEKEEYEWVNVNLIGRGRHRDEGERIGWTGTLTFEVKRPERESIIRRKVEELRAARTLCWLRTPFGRLILVALGSPEWEPLVGTGTMEMGTMTLEWEEVG